MNCCMRPLRKENLLFLVSWIVLLSFLISSCSPGGKENHRTSGELVVTAYPPPGTYPSSYNLEVTLSTNRDAYIYLTLDGTIPTPGRANTFVGRAPVYGIPILQDTWLCYFAVDLMGEQTPVNCIYYHLKPPPVSTLNPPPGAYNHPLDVTISTDSPAVIYYTTNGMDPVPGDPDTYEGKAPVVVHIPHTLTLKYYAVDNLGGSEEIHSARYIIDTIPPHSVAVPPGGNYSGHVSVTLKITNDIGTIYYTTDGADPSEKSEDLYANGGSTRIGKVKVSGIDIYSSTVVKFFAIDGVGNREFPPDANPPYNQEFYIINDVPVLYANPRGRYYSRTSITVKLVAYPEDTSIYWALDTQPVENGNYLYTQPINISGIGDHTLYFFCVRNGIYTLMKEEVYHLGYVRPPETFTEDFKSTDYVDVTSSTGVVVETGGSGNLHLDTYHAEFLMNVNSEDVDLDLSYFRNYLLVAERFGGLVIYDVSNAASVSKVATFDINPGNTATGPYLYVDSSEALNISAVAYPLGVLLIDISDPTSPQMKANLTGLSQVFYSPPVIKISGNYLYAGGFHNNSPALFIYDISNPSSPQRVALLEGVTTAGITDIEISGSTIYLLTADGHIREVYADDITRPVKGVSTLVCNNCSGTDMSVYGNYIYAGYTDTQGGNVSIVDFSDPVSPVVISRSLLSDGNYPVNGVSITGVLLAVSNGNKGVWIFDISDPRHPSKRDLITPSMAKTRAFAPGRNLIKNNVLFVIDAATGFKTFEIPYNIGQYLVNGTAFSFNVNPHEYSLKGVKLNVTQTLNGGSVDYFVSPDGGLNWYAISPDGYVEFSSTGNDLRWKAELHRGGPWSTPLIDSITLTIFYAE